MQIIAPELEISTDHESVHSARITPYYSLTSGIKQKYLRAKVKWLVDKIDYISDFRDYLDKPILKEYRLIDLKTALQHIHFPEDETKLESAKKRIAFDEMLDIQLKILERKAELAKYKSKIVDINAIQKELNNFTSSIPFELTKDQKTAIQEILNDLSKDNPMYRLLQGDVGSGKTIVAAYAAFACVLNGYNVAIMSPTTILASQTFQSLKKFIRGKDIFLITSSTQKRVNSTTKLDTKDSNTLQRASIYIGTHALLHQEEIKRLNLGLVIIDEQHRFGVEQRQQLLKLQKDTMPHYLVMTATPIPRTMMLSLFGDMNTSIIKSKPSGRKETLTYLVPSSKKEDSYNWINKQIKKGQQIFWVCPVIEENEDSPLKSIQKVEKELKPNIKGKIKILHGKMKEEDKNKILEGFRNKEFDVLLSTTVIEVGIDVPNANIIVIESAEQFGLAQLHQLRGRVGRGGETGYCFLYTENENNKLIIDRLNFFCKEKDGLKISEYDLKRRGPGEVYGKKQSGIPNLKYASIYDIDLIENTRKAAKKLLSNS
jgi:ATP-dependent DNA helicase RecG